MLFTSIIEELTKLGWGPEIEKIPGVDDLSHHKLVKQPTRLTPRSQSFSFSGLMNGSSKFFLVWSNIRDEMIRHMEQLKAQRLERERKLLIISRKRIAVSILRAYKSAHLPFTDIMPEPVDFCAFPPVSEIIELPTEMEITEASFSSVVAHMDELVTQWRRSCYDMLIQQLKEQLSRKLQRVIHEQADPDTASSSAIDPKDKGKAKAVEPCDADLTEALSLATTVFRCKACSLSPLAFFDEGPWGDSWFSGVRSNAPRSPLFYPNVMGHRCLTKQRQYGSDYLFADSTIQLSSPPSLRTKWSCVPLQLDNVAKDIVSKVVEACSLDPLTTTTVQMDFLNPKLACLECVTWDPEIQDLCQASVFTWRAAVGLRWSSV